MKLVLAFADYAHSHIVANFLAHDIMALHALLLEATGKTEREIK
jgi:hypothetical protein